MTAAEAKDVPVHAPPCTDDTSSSVEGVATHAAVADAMSKSFQAHAVPRPTYSGSGRVKEARGLPVYAYSADGPMAQLAQPDVGPMKNIV